ncbi:acetylxylan esterase [Arenibacter sp. F26102]|uniref:alpha/beta hydrolase family protein n=1 Tax=Arenibacter sp. F26102 TaxID=2926416 RepID=UPI001FF5B5F0|nr:acetylxylan esterase [Arenibacter sp. F26102]MCK0148030.1 acetylxylan esterase [Arenibacter sp. F26102]
MLESLISKKHNRIKAIPILFCITLLALSCKDQKKTLSQDDLNPEEQDQGEKDQKTTLRQGAFFSEEQGKAELDKIESMYSNKEDWEPRKKILKSEILKGLNLSPLPNRTPLNAVIGSKRIMAGYSVENVYFESIPGFYVFGNLYRPLDNTKKHPAVLSVHGHFPGDNLGESGRFREDQQKRCATLAQMGAAVFSYSMYGWGEGYRQLDANASIENPDNDIQSKLHHVPLALAMQTWNSIRAIDFLETLPDVDSEKIAITGASGGGTQTFLLSAVDERVSVSVPVVMVSSHFFGGCNCESGLPIHQSAEHFTNNTEIAAMMAPKPMLMISDGDDWTKNVPLVEYPFVKRTYSFYNADGNVENVHFPDGVHDYNYDKRTPVYNFMAKHLGLDIEAVKDKNGKIDESKSQLESASTMLSYSDDTPFPSNALQGQEAIDEAFENLSK